MANVGFGLRPVGRIGGGENRVRDYYIAASNATALFEGDVVALSGAIDPLNEVAGVTQFATTNKAAGIVVGFRPLPAYPYQAYRQASVGQYVEVMDDPHAIYAVLEDAVGGSVSAANVAAFDYAALIVAAGSTVTGLSGTMLDSSTASAATTNCDVQIIGVLRNGQNQAGQAGGATLLVKMLNPVLV